MSDEIITGVMKAIQRSSLKIPEDIAVIAIRNGFIPKLFFPEITCVETNGDKPGRLAFKRSMTWIVGSAFIQELTTASVLVDGELM